MSAWPPADLVGLLEGDPHGCALATAVRGQDGAIIDFTLTYLNDAGSRFLERPRDELIGRTYRQLWPETVTDGTLPLYRRVVQERVPVVRTVYYDRATVAGHFEFRVMPFGDGFVARFVDLSKLTMGPRARAAPGSTTRSMRLSTGSRCCGQSATTMARSWILPASTSIRSARNSPAVPSRTSSVSGSPSGGQCGGGRPVAVPGRRRPDRRDVAAPVDLVEHRAGVGGQDGPRRHRLRRGVLPGRHRAGRSRAATRAQRRPGPYCGATNRRAAERHRGPGRGEHSRRGVRGHGHRGTTVRRRTRSGGAADGPGPSDVAVPRRLRGPRRRTAEAGADVAPVPGSWCRPHRAAPLLQLTAGVRRRPARHRQCCLRRRPQGVGVPPVDHRWSGARHAGDRVPAAPPLRRRRAGQPDGVQQARRPGAATGPAVPGATVDRRRPATSAAAGRAAQHPRRPARRALPTLDAWRRRRRRLVRRHSDQRRTRPPS